MIAKAAGMPPLTFMEGFYNWTEITLDEVKTAVDTLGFEERNKWASDLLQALYQPGNLPIKWSSLQPSPLHILLNHSDCDGIIESAHCAAIADALEALLPKLPDGDGGGHIGDWREKTRQFILGLRRAAEAGEDVDFH